MENIKTVAGVAQPLKNAGWVGIFFKKLILTTGYKMSCQNPRVIRAGIF
ncbi:MAG: hypothetical protein ABIO05_00945 [Ferruginibacter sp.]